MGAVEDLVVEADRHLVAAGANHDGPVAAHEPPIGAAVAPSPALPSGSWRAAVSAAAPPETRSELDASQLVDLDGVAVELGGSFTARASRHPASQSRSGDPPQAGMQIGRVDTRARARPRAGPRQPSGSTPRRRGPLLTGCYSADRALRPVPIGQVLAGEGGCDALGLGFHTPDTGQHVIGAHPNR